MSSPLRILMVADSDDEALLLVRELQRGGYDPASERVDAAGAMAAALATQGWDLILCDSPLPHLDALAAIRVVHDSGLDLPIIVISGTMGAEAAVETMKAGAHDVVLKDNLSRLVPAVGRALEKATMRRARDEAEEELRRSSERLLEMRQYLAHLIESSPDAIISTNREGRVVLFNKGAEDMLGYRRNEVIGRPVPVLYQSAEQAKAVMRRMREGGGSVSALETTLQAKDGSLIPVLISASILYDQGGQEVGTVGFNKDLRERKRAEEELRQAHLELQRAYENLEQAQRSAITAEKLAALGGLIAGVSHEILNPLNVITLTLYTMMDDPAIPPEVHQYCGEMKEQADRIIKIAQNLLYVARQHPPERLPLDLNEMIERDLELLGNDLRLRNIAVEFNLAEKLPPVLADQDQLQQVVLNLLTNARDAMPRGGRLILNTEAIEADGHRFVGLRVEDTGEGIPPEHLDKLFDPFFTTKGEGKGTGLGLSICQGIIESHGGSIWAESVPGGGAAFIVRLSVEDD